MRLLPGQQHPYPSLCSQRQIVVHAQYVKDLSFENPNAPDILMSPPAQPMSKFLNVGARGLNGEQYEVTLMLSAKAKREDKTLFAELSYCAIYRRKAGVDRKP